MQKLELWLELGYLHNYNHMDKVMISIKGFIYNG